MKIFSGSRGNILMGTVMILMVLLLLMPALFRWTQRESRWTVKQQKTTKAFQLAQSAVDRGVWMLKSSTTTWTQALAGTAIAGYDGSVAYDDAVNGGRYRVRFVPGPIVNANDQVVTVIGEGRDPGTGEIRAIRAVYQNTPFPSPIMAGGDIKIVNGLKPHWAPVMSQANVRVEVPGRFYPRKMARLRVIGDTSLGAAVRDPNDHLTSPNWNLAQGAELSEWRSGATVPALPRLDFDALRISAQGSGTYNFYTTASAPAGLQCTDGSPNNQRCRRSLPSLATTASRDTAAAHALLTDSGIHFFNSHRHPESKNNRVWFWEGDVQFTSNKGPGGTPAGAEPNYSNYLLGAGCVGMGIRGTIVVMGNMTIDSGDCLGGMAYTTPIPQGASREYATIDTGGTAVYPGDAGTTNAANFVPGVDQWLDPDTGNMVTTNGDVGIIGLVYVQGNLTLGRTSDIMGVVFVGGDVSDVSGESAHVYFNNNFNVPLMDVVLTKTAWAEVSSSTQTW